MRAIPFRHVCLLGLNDGEYPRTRVPMDFDLMGRDYRPGDRSRREDDRYLFLEALLSARQKLLISWVGRSINDNTVRPPSVLVGQLCDHLAAGWRLAGDEDQAEEGALLGALTIEHRLQPFNPDYFPVSASASPLFTYAHEWRMADDRPTGGTQQLAPVGRGEPLRIAELASFLRDPVKAFFRQRLHVDFDIDDPASEDQEPFDLDGLQKWSLWNELIVSQAEALNAGQPREEALAASLERIQRRGELAAKAFADVMIDDLAAPMADMFERYAKGFAEWPHEAPHDELVSHTHPATGLSIDDWLRDLRLNADEERGRVVLEPSDAVKNGKYQRHHLIKHWLVHLVGHLGGQPLTTLIVSKAGNVRFEPLEPDEARAQVDTLLAAWQDGMRRPLPLAIKTAFAWLDGSTSAQSVYEGGYKLTGELESSPYLRRTWPDFETLTRDGEFARLADSLLRPLFTATFVESARTRKAAATAGEQA